MPPKKETDKIKRSVSALRSKKYYADENGNEPAREYIGSLGIVERMRIFVQIDRLKAGNAGHGHGVGSGVQELKIDSGPGYRVYYGIVDEDTLIILLTAGDKSTQKNDIKKAQEYFADFLNRRVEKGDEQN